ncbi:hypothetical protein GMW39_20665 [Pectobacterium parmentieri]|uniref:hypothetical protein n=1 Tax=Pectobacterium parmentieri TaxID=1905730 RepID=UPI0013741603|nr:hypothetical protein [Pectobacterium parmentieri]QHQ17995.1 hypothetical protein GMW39_20665 [Pectobacterium parmentieri]
MFDPSDTRILVQDLEPNKHKDILYSFELLSMNGSVEKIKKRLTTYFNDGINLDEQIRILYPEVELPPKGYTRIKESELDRLYELE